MSWQSFETFPEDGHPVLVYSPELVDADFNPHGVIEAVWNPEGVLGAVWNAEQDCWDTVVLGNHFDLSKMLWQPQPRGPER